MTAAKLDAEAFGKALASARLQTGDNSKPLATMFVTYRREANKNALAEVMEIAERWDRGGFWDDQKEALDNDAVAEALRRMVGAMKGLAEVLADD